MNARRLNLTNWLFCYARSLRGSGGRFSFPGESTTTQAQSLSISVLGWTAHLARLDLDLDHSVKAEANFSLSFECWESFQEIPISTSLVSERQWQLRHRGKTFW